MASQREINPLLNEVVIQVVCSHLENSELKAIRFVHTSWAKEAFNRLRKSSAVKLDRENLNEFLNSGLSNRFYGFGFQIQHCDWNEDFLSYLTTAEPKYMEVYFLLTLSKKNLHDFHKFFNILRQYSNKIRLLCLNIICEELEIQPSVENYFLKLQYPSLKCLIIRNENIEPEWLIPFSVGILKCSPKLTEIESNIQNVEFWKTLRGIKDLHTLSVPKITTEIIESCVHAPNLNLKKLCIQFDPTEILVMLSRFANSLEYLEFFTPKESALSPIEFPVMPRLKFLSAGQSQLSFPSIKVDKLPVLENLSATYWDWVFTFEVLPDIHYYWRTSHPHENVTTLEIKFPERAEISGDYIAMENFTDFSNRIQIKFSNLTNILLTNVVIKEFMTSCIGVITEAFGPQLKQLIVKKYSPTSDCDSSRLFSSLSNCNALEILDLDPCSWSSLWKNKKISRNINFEEFCPVIAPFTKLRILKIPYMEDFSIENLFGINYDNFPELSVLAIVGGLCVNRFHKDKLKRCRSNLKFTQYDCSCAKEDSWCAQDVEESHSIFHRLYETQ